MAQIAPADEGKDEYRVCLRCDKFLPLECFCDDSSVCNACDRTCTLRHSRTIECAHCGREFEVCNHARIYCSDDCQYQAARVEQSRGRFLIFERDDFQCFYCGKTSYSDRTELHVDHIIPVARGGEDIAINLVTACQRCNLEKSAMEIRNLDPLIREVRRRNIEADINDGKRIKLPGGDRQARLKGIGKHQSSSGTAQETRSNAFQEYFGTNRTPVLPWEDG